VDPIIRWAGSKRALLPKLRKYWLKPNARYIEPFCGSGCLFFDLEPAVAVLGDINPELIATYRAIRNHPGQVIESLLRLKISRQTYYRLRAINPFSLSDSELAARFLFLNKLCFNGIYRTNQKGMFNVPYGAPKTKAKFDPSQLLEASQMLKRVTLLNADFEATARTAENGDFVYLDPPYAVSNRRVFKEYHPDSFTDSDLKRLKGLLVDLDKKGATFVVSYADCKEARELMADWSTSRVRTRRNVAGFSDHRKAAFELMASNLELRV
jgi:DNA adenine methylase